MRFGNKVFKAYFESTYFKDIMWRFISHNSVPRVHFVQRGKQRKDKSGDFHGVDSRLWVRNEKGGSRTKGGRLPRMGIYLTIWMKAGSAFSAIGIVHLGDALIGKCIVIVVTQVIRLLMRDTSFFLEADPSS